MINTKPSKFDQIIESYVNGNISWVKKEVAKLSTAQRKKLYEYASGPEWFSPQISSFFFKLI